MSESEHHAVTLYSWQDVKIQLLISINSFHNHLGKDH